MKKVTLAITAGLLANLNFDSKAEPTAEEVEGAIKGLAHTAGQVAGLETEITNLKKDKSKLEKDLSDLKATTANKEVTDMLETALSAGKITAKLKTTLAGQYEGRPEDLKAVLDEMPARQSITGKIKEGQGKTEDLSGKTFDELHQMGKLADLKRDDPEAYKELYKAEFGVYPKGM